MFVVPAPNVTWVPDPMLTLRYVPAAMVCVAPAATVTSFVPTETVCFAIVGAETAVCTSAPKESLVPCVSVPAYESVPEIDE
jgi:hypothetical protein